MLIAFSSWSAEKKTEEILDVFSGHVSRINADAELVRIRVQFENAKYIQNNDKIYFWFDTNPNNRCRSYVVGKSSEYVLLRVPDYLMCVSKVGITVGSYLKFQSDDLKKHMEIGQSLIEILLKKRLALRGKVYRHQNDLNAYIEKVDAVNKRFAVLREQLELEWEQELSSLAEEKSDTLKDLQSAQMRLDDVDHKLERYRIHDENLKTDRWALDIQQYLKK